MNRPTKISRVKSIANAFSKRAKFLGTIEVIRECNSYTKRYNDLLKRNNSYNRKYGLLNFSFYFHIVEAFPEIDKKELVNYIPYTITYAVYIKNNINRAKYTYDKLSFYKNAIKNNIAIPTIYGYTDSHSKFIPVQREYEDFIDRLSSEMVIGKPRMANSGHGVVIVHSNDEMLPNYVYQEKAMDHTAIQSLTLSEYPSTIRLALYNNEGDLEVIGSHIRLNAGTVIDHIFSGSIYVDIDSYTGALRGFGLDSYSKRFWIHPKSNIKIDGFQIPFWNEVITEASKVCKSHKELPLIGLDIVITENGPVILEINGGFNTFGIQFKNQLGKHEVFKKYLDGFE